MSIIYSRWVNYENKLILYSIDGIIMFTIAPSYYIV